MTGDVHEPLVLAPSSDVDGVVGISLFHGGGGVLNPGHVVGVPGSLVKP